MHLHRILFVILGNLLKPPTHPSHLLGSTATPPHALSHSHQWQLARWQLSPAVLPGTSKQVLKSGKGCQKQPVTFLAQAWPWEQPGKEKKSQKITKDHHTCICCGEVTCTQFRGQKYTARQEAAQKQQRFFLAVCRHRVWRLFSCLFLTPCPKDKKTNSLLTLRLMEVLELENYLLLNNSTETSHHKFSVATAQEVQTELCFLALGSFHILYLQFYFWTQQICQGRSASCSLWKMSDEGAHVFACTWMHFSSVLSGLPAPI